MKIREGLDRFVGAPPSTVQNPKRHLANPFYCDAIDELGALAVFLQAWEKTNG